MTKCAFVTGVSSGIGKAIAQYFSEKGWRVIGLDRTPISHKYTEDFHLVDLADPKSTKKFLENIEKNMLSVDALINNAAYQVCSPIEETSDEAWDEVMQVNLKAPFQLTRTLLPGLKINKGAVVNICSVHSLATSHSIAAYASSKGGLLAFTRAAALEFASSSVRVNAVLPGAIDTDMLRDGLRRMESKQKDARAVMKEFVDKHPVGRIGHAEDIAKAVYFLADSSQSSYITGQSLVVDGGVMARLSTE